jgi:chromosome segregation ATPase
VAGRDGRNGRTGRDGSLTGATAELIIELSREVDQLKRRVHELELAAQDAQGRITLLQSELALANSEVCALEELVREQAERINGLRNENEKLRLSVARLIKRTGALPGIEPNDL